MSPSLTYFAGAVIFGILFSTLALHEENAAARANLSSAAPAAAETQHAPAAAATPGAAAKEGK
jgi:hypothetical protein